MARGISIHVGLNEVDPSAFPGATPLRGCRNDAIAMCDLAKSQGFEAQLILDKEATFKKVVSAVGKAAEDLKDQGDIFLFTFAGHGSQEGDADADEPAPDFKDETILLHDFMLIDDYLNRVLLPMFKPGVRVLGVSDSCHSGSLFVAPSEAIVGVQPDERLLVRDVGLELTKCKQVVGIGRILGGRRTILRATRRDHFVGSKSFYEDLRKDIPSRENAPPVKASVILLAACSDVQDALDGEPHGAFTQALLDVWGGSSFSGNYNDFVRSIGKKLKGVPQTPGLTAIGSPFAAFIAQRPFFI